MALNLATDYAIRALVALAQNKEKQMKVSEIAKQENISSTYLNKILQKLSKNKLVSTRSGVNGGVTLSRNPNKITLKEVVMAMQGKNLLRCIKCDHAKCNNFSTCKLYTIIEQAETEFMKLIKRATLQDLLKA